MDSGNPVRQPKKIGRTLKKNQVHTYPPPRARTLIYILVTYKKIAKVVIRVANWVGQYFQQSRVHQKKKKSRVFGEFDSHALDESLPVRILVT